jgi:hypothetical protein
VKISKAMYPPPHMTRYAVTQSPLYSENIKPSIQFK